MGALVIRGTQTSLELCHPKRVEMEMTVVREKQVEKREERPVGEA